MVSWVWCSAALAGPWSDLEAAGAPLVDAVGDGVTGPLDLVGDGNVAAIAWWASEDTLSLRARVGSDAAGAAGGWAFLLDTDADADTFESGVLATSYDGVARLDNPTHVPGTWVPEATVTPIAGATLTFVVDGGWSFVEVTVPRSALEAAPAPVLSTTPIRIAAVTTVAWPLGVVDVSACTGAPCDRLGVASSAVVTIDADDDHATDVEEAERGTDPSDVDTDDDGLADGEEPDDLDGDGVPDGLECDTDGDGIRDGTERGLTVDTPDTADGGCFTPDADPSTTTDPARADTDGGGLADGVEDVDHDGRVDPWETDPGAAADDVDTDSDGIPDVLDDLFGVGADLDSDGDGVADADETVGDPDNDGVPSFADPDADGDGHSDGAEGVVDTDGDGVPDLLDLDSDGDGLGDPAESDLDWDLDRAVDRVDPDSDDDGLLDGEDGSGDADGDGFADLHDGDADGDGLVDGDEGLGDTDGDGLPDARDPDSDGDGWPDAVEGAEDTDRDGVPDYLDPDSDADGLPDAFESGADEDCDGEPNRIDGDREDGGCEPWTDPPVADGAPPAPPAYEGSGCDTGLSAALRGCGWVWVAASAGALARRRRGRGRAPSPSPR